jgi:adhesin transport system outer membrane protein
MPTVALEGRALAAKDSDAILGRRDELSGKVVATWDIFRGGQDLWKRSEMAERFSEQSMRLARLQRDAFESIDKAWAARTITNDRVAALTRQIEADRRVIIAYGKEYELGQRSLIDLLNAQNQLFNGLVSLESSRSVLVFADYQLLAAMGQLLAYLKTTRPVDSEPLEPKPFLLFPTKLPPILVDLPQPGKPEPINVVPGKVPPTGPWNSSKTPTPRPITLSDRWPSWSVPVDGKAVARWRLEPNAALAQADASAGTAMSFTQDMMRLTFPVKPTDVQ